MRNLRRGWGRGKHAWDHNGETDGRAWAGARGLIDAARRRHAGPSAGVHAAADQRHGSAAPPGPAHHGVSAQQLLSGMCVRTRHRTPTEWRRHHTTPALLVGAALVRRAFFDGTTRRPCAFFWTRDTGVRDRARSLPQLTYNSLLTTWEETMRRSTIAAIASFTMLAFAPSSQASPLVRGGDLAATPQSDVLQVGYGYYGHRHQNWYQNHHYGWYHHHHDYWHHRHYGWDYHHRRYY